MFKIPPVIGLLIALVVGIGTGGIGTHFYHKKEQAEADARQLKKDDKKAATIARDTEKAKRDNTVTGEIVKYKNIYVEVPKELTEDEIHGICINHYLPDHIMQSIRAEAAKARQRIDNLYNDNAAGGP
jgi:hypothetical protein